MSDQAVVIENNPWLALCGKAAIEARIAKLTSPTRERLARDADDNDIGAMEQASMDTYANLASKLCLNTDETMQPVSVSRWGKDHWSTLAYIETCCVDHRVRGWDVDAGQLSIDSMRTDRYRHGEIVTGQAANSHFESAEAVGSHPTRLRGEELEGHDDWDCLLDIAVAGMVEIVLFCRGWVQLTPLGHKVAGLLRTHKARGGTFSNFQCTLPEVTK